MNDENGDIDEKQNLVEEFPKPPFYYSQPGIEPPAIPSAVQDPYEVVYGGSLAATKIRPIPSKSGPEFADAMKEALKEVIELALPLISVTTRDEMQISLIANLVKKALGELFEIMRDYRSHEALALLLEDLKGQLQKAEKVEEALSLCIKRCQAKRTQLS
eukprot:scaffold3290_cov165-Ochromonas_danica.AAC.19